MCVCVCVCACVCVYRSPQRREYLPPPKAHQLSPSSCASLISHTSLSISSPRFVLHLPVTRNQQAQPLLRLQKPASLSASATLLQRLVLHASHHFVEHTHTHTHTMCCALLLTVIYTVKRPVGSTRQPRGGLTWTIHGC